MSTALILAASGEQSLAALTPHAGLKIALHRNLGVLQVCRLGPAWRHQGIPAERL